MNQLVTYVVSTIITNLLICPYANFVILSWNFVSLTFILGTPAEFLLSRKESHPSPRKIVHETHITTLFYYPGPHEPFFLFCVCTVSTSTLHLTQGITFETPYMKLRVSLTTSLR